MWPCAFALPFLLARSIFLLPDLFDVIQLFGSSVHDGESMFSSDDDLLLSPLNVCRRTDFSSAMYMSLQLHKANLTGVPRSYDFNEDGPLSSSTTCSFSLTISTNRRELVEAS